MRRRQRSRSTAVYGIASASAPTPAPKKRPPPRTDSASNTSRPTRRRISTTEFIPSNKNRRNKLRLTNARHLQRPPLSRQSRAPLPARTTLLVARRQIAPPENPPCRRNRNRMLRRQDNLVPRTRRHRA